MSRDRVFIIAEAGVNHNGCLSKAYKLVEAASEAGADAVKFQTFQAEKLTTVNLAKADYQQKAVTCGRTQQEMLKALELSFDDHIKLKNFCYELGIEFMSTAFDLESLQFLVEEIKIKRIKIPSGELVNGPLILEAAKTRLPIILSTGMSTLNEIIQSLSVIAWNYLKPNESIKSSCNLKDYEDYRCWPEPMRKNVSVLHCISEYPASAASANLRFMDTLRDSIHLPIGFSDHSEGITIPQAACARGATILEKHITLSKSLPGPDHQASIEPEEFKLLVAAIREIEVALGTNNKNISKQEFAMRLKARPSLVSSRKILEGEKFTKENVTIKRAGGGVTPLKYWDYIFQNYSTRNYCKDEVLEEV